MASSMQISGDGTVASRVRPKSNFIVSPLYDSVLFIGSPLLSLALGIWVVYSVPLFLEPAQVFGIQDAWIQVLLPIWIFAHLCAVVFRSHLNRHVFNQFRYRFTLVPVVLGIGMYISDWLLISAGVLIMFWDVYHSAMQNFGFCRIYDARHGNSPTEGRRLDMMINLLFYIGPIFAGLSLASTMSVLSSYSSVGWHAPDVFWRALMENQPHLRTLMVSVGTILLIYYLNSYWQLSRQGYKVSPQKLFLLVSAGVSSIWAWGFLPPIQAFFVANFYHALQYFGIVWAQEHKNIRECFGFAQIRGGHWLALGAFIVAITAAGVACYAYRTSSLRMGAVLFALISLMHFWYDGFVWSVRKAEVR